MIPTYNQEKYIRKNIESVLSITYPNLEVVLSDDCSTDNTFLIAQEYENDPRFRAYRCKENLGRVKNYNHTLNNLVTGEWVLNCDGDDYLLESDYYINAMEIAQNNKDITIFSANRYKLKENTQKLYLQETYGSEGELDGTNFFKNYYKYNHGLLHITSLYRREDAIRANFYTTDIISSDIDSLLRIIIGKKIYHFDKVTAVWRDHDENVSKSIDALKRAKNLEMIQSLYNYHITINSLTKEELIKWKKVFYKNRIIRNSNRFLSGFNYSILFKFLKEIDRQEKGVTKSSILSPRFILTFIFPFRIKLTNLIKRVVLGDRSKKDQ